MTQAWHTRLGSQVTSCKSRSPSTSKKSPIISRECNNRNGRRKKGVRSEGRIESLLQLPVGTLEMGAESELMYPPELNVDQVSACIKASRYQLIGIIHTALIGNKLHGAMEIA